MKQKHGSEQADISLREWLVRVTSVTLAFGTAILAAGGLVIVAMTALLPRIDSQSYSGAVCIWLAWLSGMFGLRPMAQWLDREFLSTFGGLEPLPPRRRQESE
ncbi:hypothetical protein PQQ51_33415 [Paraburkholderia xenovorans]|uniref:hypothetical protein n=1 Tax=Paraburkholderia xenovorans TaxID=36873 RepID=UPI0038BB16DF